MKIFNLLEKGNFEQITFFQEPKSGLKAIIAIHSTKLGPALGGCRMYNYENEEQALQDVLNLSRGMTYKAAAAGLNLGGGKTVIIGDATKDKTDDLMKAIAECVNNLNGKYFISKDVGITSKDLQVMSGITNYIAGHIIAPSAYTAQGVFQGIKAAVKFKFNTDTLTGLKVAIQGIGTVGYNLAKLLHEAGCELYITDINQELLAKAKTEFNAEIVSLDEIYDVDCDIFAPCAMGGTINNDTIKRLKVRIVAGSANNQLSEEALAVTLKQADILYAPDYVINAGGLITVAGEIEKLEPQEISLKVDKIYDQLLNIFIIAEQEDMSPLTVADQITHERLHKE